MSKQTTLHSVEQSVKHNRRRLIKNSTYALILGLSAIMGATLIAIEVEDNTQSTASIQTSSTQTMYTCPVNNCTIQKDYNAEELQYNDTLKQWEIHKAVDIATNGSCEVFAISSGTVTNLYTNRLEGTVIEISHNNGLTSIYKSLDSNVKVALGDYVKQGQIIGYTSNSMSREQNSGEHLHFELLLNNNLVNPNNYIDFCNK